jgi:DUF4097 and DUF4098 domain-containing protein YvlB
MAATTYDVTGSLQLRVRMRSGDVRIERATDDRATVTIAGARDPGEVSIEHDAPEHGTRLEVTQRQDGWGFRSRTVDATIAVPAGATVDVGTSSGDVRVEVEVAHAQVQSGSGDVSVARVTGDARVRNASGDVQIDEVGGDLTVTTASGEITVGSVGGRLETRTTSGDVEVAATTGSTRMASASGDLSIASAGSAVWLRTVSGDIAIGVPMGMRVWFDVSSTSGDAVSELDAGAEGDAGADFEIVATSVSGDIRIRRAPARAVSTA